MRSENLVIIPTYNEIENIEIIVDAVFNLKRNFHILVVDDNSPDGTSDKVEELQLRYPGQLFLERRKEKGGLGTAYIHGFRWALKNEYSYIFEMDADFSHNPADLIRLHDACLSGADLAIGSRYVKGVNVVNWPLGRIILSYGASFYVKLITGMKVHDPTSGFVCYKRKVIESLDLDHIKFVGYAFQIEMKFRSHLLNYKMIEVPIVFTDRVRGVSKMNGRIISEAVTGVLAMKINSLFSKK